MKYNKTKIIEVQQVKGALDVLGFLSLHEIDLCICYEVVM